MNEYLEDIIEIESELVDNELYSEDNLNSEEYNVTFNVEVL